MPISNNVNKTGKYISKYIKKLIVIGGGVGPKAGAAMHDQIIEMTDNGRDKDQGHPPVIHTSFSGSVKDRTAWLKSDRAEPNPGGEMAKGINRALKGFMEYPGDMVLGIPCNTFHSKPIWNYFLSLLEHPERITVINMIEETAKKILKRQFEYGKPITVGLLSTEGTRDTGVYSDVMKEKKIKLLTLDDEQQAFVTKAIYDTDFGIKGQKPDMKEARRLISNAIDSLRPQGASLFILGCTELPLPYLAQGGIPGDCLDPAKILAKELLRQGGYALTDDNATDDEDEETTGQDGNDFLNLPDMKGLDLPLDDDDDGKMEAVD